MQSNLPSLATSFRNQLRGTLAPRQQINLSCDAATSNKLRPRVGQDEVLDAALGLVKDRCTQCLGDSPQYCTWPLSASSKPDSASMEEHGKLICKATMGS